jgi:hypothetical protein
VPQWESVVELDSVEQAEVMAGERELTPEPSELDLAEIEALPDADEVLVKIVGFAELELELKKALVETQDIQEVGFFLFSVVQWWTFNGFLTI